MKWDELMTLLPQPPDYAYDWTGLEACKPLKRSFDRMAKTPQNPQWHGEGDVWTHTRLVCQALSQMEAFRDLTPDARDALALAALLHDVGKTVCTRLEDGAWVSPNHAQTGAKLVRRLLWQEFGMCGSPVAQRTREAVCLLIRYHSKPPYLIESENPSLALMRMASNGELAPCFSLKSLFLLGRADVLGRVADDNPEFLERIDWAEALAGEEECLEGPYPFRSRRTQRALLSGGSVWRDQELYDDEWPEVVLLCGLPGVGKDTYLKRNHPELPMVSLDAIRQKMGVLPTDNQGRVVQVARERARAYLRKQQPFVWNATSLTALRAQQIGLFEDYHARVRVVYLETEWEENLRRNASRQEAVPEDVLDGMLGKLEPPERWEAREVEWICV